MSNLFIWIYVSVGGVGGEVHETLWAQAKVYEGLRTSGLV
jgi:hypothetical protein